MHSNAVASSLAPSPKAHSSRWLAKPAPSNASSSRANEDRLRRHLIPGRAFFGERGSTASPNQVASRASHYGSRRTPFGDQVGASRPNIGRGDADDSRRRLRRKLGFGP